MPKSKTIRPDEEKEQNYTFFIEGGNFAEDGKNLKPIFGRVGSKYSLIKDIISVIPPHTTYVEAFVGGGSIFWNKEPSKKSVINDLDKDLVDAYRNLKSAPLSQLQELDYLDKPAGQGNKDDYKTPTYKKNMVNLVSKLDKINSKSPAAKKLLKYFKIMRGTFNFMGKGNIYFNIDFKPYIANLDEYKRLIKDTTITNKNYIDVIKEYDSPDTFFFLDPPYENSDSLYKNDTIDYNEMNNILKGIKGKFLLTINNSKVISDIFKGFNQKKVSVTNASNSIYFVTKSRKELFISNYDMKKGAGIETNRFQEKGEVSLPEFQSVKVEVPTYMYKRLPDIVKKDGTTIPPPYRYKLVNPINSSRTIASRQKLKAVDIKRKPIPQPFTFYEESEELPKLDEFSPEDQEKIEEYYKDVEDNEKKDRDKIEEQPSNNVPRGFPVTMYKTADRLGYKETSAKVYKAKEEKPKQEKSKPVKERKPRGRPKKPAEAKKEEENEDIFQRLVKGLTEKSVEELSSRGSSKTPSKKSSKTPSVISKLSSVSSLAKDSESSSEVSSTKLSETTKSSEKSSKKSSKKAPSVASSIGSDDLNLYLTDREAFDKKYGLGIQNNFSTKNKGMNSWIKYVKDFAAKKGIKYNEALKDPECKAGYKKLKGGEV